MKKFTTHQHYWAYDSTANIKLQANKTSTYRSQWACLKRPVSDAVYQFCLQLFKKTVSMQEATEAGPSRDPFAKK